MITRRDFLKSLSAGLVGIISGCSNDFGVIKIYPNPEKYREIAKEQRQVAYKYSGFSVEKINKIEQSYEEMRGLSDEQRKDYLKLGELELKENQNIILIFPWMNERISDEDKIFLGAVRNEERIKFGWKHDFISL